MYQKGIRAVSALLLLISATVGVQNQPQNQIIQSKPEVLMSFTEKVELKESTGSAEATVSAIKAEIYVSPAPIPLASPTAEPITPEATESAQATGSSQFSREQKVARLQEFLQKYNSPMTNNAQDFVDAADQYNLDWRLVPSIAGVESTFGKRVLPGSHNPFGWGGGYIKFESWRESIYTVSKGISEKYVQDGLDTPYKMQKRYAPPSSTWGGKVDSFMQKIDSSEASKASAE